MDWLACESLPHVQSRPCALPSLQIFITSTYRFKINKEITHCGQCPHFFLLTLLQGVVNGVRHRGGLGLERQWVQSKSMWCSDCHWRVSSSSAAAASAEALESLTHSGSFAAPGCRWLLIPAIIHEYLGLIGHCLKRMSLAPCFLESWLYSVKVVESYWLYNPLPPSL